MDKSTNKFVSFGKRLRAFCAENNVSNKQLSDLMGVTENSVSGYMQGVRLPNGENLLAIKTNLEVSVDWLLTGEVTRGVSVDALPEPLMRRLERLKPDDLRLLYVWLDGLLAGRED